MHRLGRDLAGELRAGDVLLLHGDLGAGKTALTQGIAAGLRVPEAIQSPTFGLVAEHDGLTADGHPIRLYHLDLYRLESPAELESLGFDRYVDPDDGITVIEWPERAIGWLPERFMIISIAHAGPDDRIVTIRVVGATE
ncbi:MAG: tRNA threonylcarbamoyladenosine biosynthesis protein TsaE [uncultured Thermomicrobiales bacterium]|uniref:tRNA threonylcarbamoyladenosine biosynthesis protein TsaE n=1 Tax=uncultured Thermomicrobiales bacterium TaxID=1645740 RepID=A0A6J4UQM7_9BACT|nr:MAG: tRNA threonylcarbamoyladenosine biosynthesis protein TsaE [uncultured Thermomicrobiales bacterium]